jgi:UDP-glucose 4-epimerase
VNIGQPNEVTIEELAELIRTITASTSTIEHVPYAVAYEPGFEDMRRRVPEVALLRELTGSVPSTPLEATIREIVASLEAELAESLVPGPSIA